MDYRLPKPHSLQGYELHRIAASLAGGHKVLFADRGDHLLLRTGQPLDLDVVPLPAVALGAVLGFELRACVGVKTRGKHRYFAPADWRSRHQWLTKKGEQHGFSVIALHCTARPFKLAAGKHQYTLDQTDFTGVLKVTDLARFQAALAEGVGNTGRAFGFGLLVI